jgi:Uma2 family endonuclease
VVTHRDLPDSDGEIVQNPYQLPQAAILTSSIMPVLDQLHGDEPYLVASDVGIYWLQTKNPLDGCRAPDWFYVPGVSANDENGIIRSYVMWNHGIPPVIVMEFVSGDGREEHDRTHGKGKFWVYEQGIGATYYVIFDAFHDGKLEVYELVRNHYRPVALNERGHFPIAELGVELGVWQGEHSKVHGYYMRFFDSDGRMLPIPEELTEAERHRAEQERRRAEQEKQSAEQEKQRAEQERQRAEQEKLRADRLVAELNEIRAKLQAKGIDPGSL